MVTKSRSLDLVIKDKENLLALITVSLNLLRLREIKMGQSILEKTKHQIKNSFKFKEEISKSIYVIEPEEMK